MARPSASVISGPSTAAGSIWRAVCAEAVLDQPEIGLWQAQSGLTDGPHGLTKAGDPGLRRALYLAADQARKVDPTLAERYHRLVVKEGKHHVSALCSIARCS